MVKKGEYFLKSAKIRLFILTVKNKFSRNSLQTLFGFLFDSQALSTLRIAQNKLLHRFAWTKHTFKPYKFQSNLDSNTIWFESFLEASVLCSEWDHFQSQFSTELQFLIKPQISSNLLQILWKLLTNSCLAKQRTAYLDLPKTSANV